MEVDAARGETFEGEGPRVAKFKTPDPDPETEIDREFGPIQEDGENSKELPMPKRDINDLLHLPPNLATMRQQLFEVKGAVDLKIDEFELYWPYVDNVWVRQHRAGKDKSGRITTDYYACRLQRPTYTPKRYEQARPEGKPLRKKRAREGGTCQMRLKTVRYDGGYSKYTVSRVGEHEHTHDLDHMDRIKRNTVVMEIARAEVMKGFMPASVFTIMSEDEESLAAAGGRYLNRNDVRNASQAWRQAHRDQLAVHDGYKYDQGNGIVKTDTTPVADPPNIITEMQMLDPALTEPPELSSGPPPGTLRFLSPPNTFLTPYLPPKTPPSNLPFVTLTYATSLDSFLSIEPNQPTPLSGPLSKAMTHYLRSKHDAILIGVGTALADDPGLNCRLEGVGGFGGLAWSGQPRPVIIDPNGRWLLNSESRILRTVAEGKGKAPWIIVSPGLPLDPARLEMLKFFGGKYLGLPLVEENPIESSFPGGVPQRSHHHHGSIRFSWEAIFRALYAEGVRSVMVEGGGGVINELLQLRHARLVSSVVVTVAPTYLGTGGVGVCPARNVDAEGRPKPVVRFTDVKWEPLGEDVVMCGRLAGDGSMGLESAGGVASRFTAQVPNQG